MLQQLVTAVHQRDQELATIKAQANGSQQPAQGLKTGTPEATRAAVAEILAVRFSAVPPDVREQLHLITDGDQLKILLRWAMTVDSTAVFQEGIRRQFDTVSGF